MSEDKPRIAPNHADLLAWLGELLPEAVTEGEVRNDRLLAALGAAEPTTPEKYAFTWAGRLESTQLLQVPSRGALEPDVDASGQLFGEAPHVFIEGDNLEALKLLYRAYFGRVKMIYIDPPYNTGKEFIYRDDYSDPLDTYLQLSGQQDEEGNLLTSNPETSGRYHSTWLSLMYPRLFLARQLLTEDGVIFVSIDDHEAHNLRMIMNEVFGEENFVGQIVVQLNPRGRHLDRFVAKTHEYVMAYARDSSQQAMYALEKPPEMVTDYDKNDGRGQYREIGLRNRNPAFNRKTRPKLFYPLFIDPDSGRVALKKTKAFSVEVTPKNSKGEDSCWTWGKDKILKDGEILGARKTRGGSWRVFRKDYLISEDGSTATTLPKALWTDKELNNDYGKKAIQDLFDGENLFDFPKSPALIEKLVLIGSEPGDIVLDFFAGSGTTGHAVLSPADPAASDRRFILIELPEPTAPDSRAFELGYLTTSAICEERLRRVIAQVERESDHALPLSDNAVAAMRVFRLAESSRRGWRGIAELDPGEYVDQMEAFAESLKDDFDPLAVAWEIALEEGFPLSSSMESATTEDHMVHTVTDPTRESILRICLDTKISLAIVDELGLNADDRLICRDSALTDEIAANLALSCDLKTI